MPEIVSFQASAPAALPPLSSDRRQQTGPGSDFRPSGASVMDHEVERASAHQFQLFFGPGIKSIEPMLRLSAAKSAHGYAKASNSVSFA